MRSEPDEWELEEEGEDPMGERSRPQRRLPSRRSRRSRGRKPSFGFGHFMLPIVGLVAVGILVLGVRMFFFPSPGNMAQEKVDEPVQVTAPAAETPDEMAASTDAQVIAVPEGSTPAEPNQPPKAEAVKPKVETAKPRTETAKTGEKAVDPSPSAKPGASQPQKTVTAQSRAEVQSSGKVQWNVQVGAFKDRANAESLLQKLRQEGYSAFLVDARAGESVLSKVLVRAGEDRESADTLAKKLIEKGYPVLVVKLP